MDCNMTKRTAHPCHNMHDDGSVTYIFCACVTASSFDGGSRGECRCAMLASLWFMVFCTEP